MRFLRPTNAPYRPWADEPRRGLLAALVSLGCAGGCWETVPFDAASRPRDEPSRAAATGPVEANPPTDPAGGTVASDGTASEASPPVLPDEPDADALFSDDGAPAPDGPETTRPDTTVATLPSLTPTPPVTPLPEPSPTPPPSAAAPTAAERQQAWTLASDWALAAAVHAKGLPAARYESYLKLAGEAADALGIALPPLPTVQDGDQFDGMVTAAYRDGAGAELEAAIAQRVDPAAGAAARLALDAHLLLLTYTPAGSTVWGDAAELRDAGVASQLPAEMWRPLVELLDRRAEFVDVRAGIFTLREAVAAHLALTTGP